ncbi:molybdopterin-dependent oxidoreductase [Maricaulis sp. CAU 1757]
MRSLIMTVLLLIGLVACSREPDDAMVAEPAILTLFGAIEEANRGPVLPETEPLFTALAIDFSTALTLGRSDLTDLPQHTVITDYPADAGSRVFVGPLMRDVIALADPQADFAVITGLDGYSRKIGLRRFEEFGAILAVEMEGNALPMGGFGPTMLVWPRRSNPALIGMPDDDWVWGVLTIEIVER